MYEILFISFGAILGANARFLILGNLKNFNLKKDIPILVINTLASFCLGLFLSVIDKFGSFVYSYQLVLFFSVGFLGSFSTFSSFIYDLLDLCVELKFYRGLKLFIISYSLGISAYAFGFFLISK
tara:strand:+ start:206 stop:580 length:375 start_codon:yes stop_codon:yes gene_type:complete